MPLIIGLQTGSSLDELEQAVVNLDNRVTTLEQGEQSHDEELRDLFGRLLYAHCGNDTDTAAQQYPALLRGDPSLATNTRTPRLITYFGGTIYDNAPADYAGGDYIN